MEDFYDDDIKRDFMTLYNALKLLPGVMPKKAKKLIEWPFTEHFINIDTNAYECKSLIPEGITKEQWNELCIETYGYYGSTIRISPSGASLLLKLYYDGFLPICKGSLISKTSSLDDYIALKDNFKLRFENAKRNREHFDYLLNNPSAVKECDFSYSLLDKLFYKHQGPLTCGVQIMSLDGIIVTKYLRRYSSNSGKTWDYEVSLSWKGHDGQRHELLNESLYKDNRRNRVDD